MPFAANDISAHFFAQTQKPRTFAGMGTLFGVGIIIALAWAIAQVLRNSK